MNNTAFREGRTKLLRLTNQRLVDVITSRLTQAASIESLCLPADVSVHGAWYDIERDGWMVRLASAEWPADIGGLYENKPRLEQILEWPSVKLAAENASAVHYLQGEQIDADLAELASRIVRPKFYPPWNFADALARQIDADLCALAGTSPSNASVAATHAGCQVCEAAIGGTGPKE